MKESTDKRFQVDYARLRAGKFISEENLRSMLECGALNSRLEENFNKHDAAYNRKVVVKAMELLRLRQLKFSEISEIRVAFEVYSADDASGVPALVEPVTQAMKLLERVMAPTKLEEEIQKQQLDCVLPSRIQLYEFFDLVIKCSTLKEAYRDMKQRCSSSSEDITETHVPDISKLLRTSDQQLVDYLDESYKASLYKKVDPCPVPVGGDKRAVSLAARRRLRSSSIENRCALVPPLERSQQQLHQARNGTVVLSSSQCTAMETSSRPRTSMSLQKRSTSKLRQGEKLHEDDLVRGSLSAPDILYEEQESGEDLSDAISRICLDSVKRAREAVCCSLTGLEQPPSSSSSCTTLPVMGEESSGIKPGQSTRRGVALTEIVSKEDVRRHQDKISELQWEGLKRNTLY